MYKVEIKAPKILEIFNEVVGSHLIIPKNLYLLEVLSNNKFTYEELHPDGNKDYTKLVYLPTVDEFENIKSYQINELYEGHSIDMFDILTIDFNTEEDAFYFKLQFS